MYYKSDNIFEENVSKSNIRDNNNTQLKNQN